MLYRESYPQKSYVVKKESDGEDVIVHLSGKLRMNGLDPKEGTRVRFVLDTEDETKNMFNRYLFSL